MHGVVKKGCFFCSQKQCWMRWDLLKGMVKKKKRSSSLILSNVSVLCMRTSVTFVNAEIYFKIQIVRNVLQATESLYKFCNKHITLHSFIPIVLSHVTPDERVRAFHKMMFVYFGCFLSEVDFSPLGVDLRCRLSRFCTGNTSFEDAIWTRSERNCCVRGLKSGFHLSCTVSLQMKGNRSATLYGMFPLFPIFYTQK